LTVLNPQVFLRVALALLGGFGMLVQPIDNAVCELFSGLETVQQKLAVAMQNLGYFELTAGRNKRQVLRPV